MNELSTKFLDQTGKEKLNGGGLTSRIEKNKERKKGGQYRRVMIK